MRHFLQQFSVAPDRYLVTPVSEQVDLYLLKNTLLLRTRDLLLPRLIFGEVDVSELDITIPEEATA
jgi:type I restriction enzyme S subunit